MSQPAIEVTAPEGVEAGPIRGRSAWELFRVRFVKDRVAVVGAGIIGFLVVIAIAAPLFAALTDHGPNELFNRTMLSEIGLPEGPNGDFWFGADQAGRDVFVRTIYGARTSLIIAFGATGIATLVGVALGMTAGYLGGPVDILISRIVEITLSMPYLLFAIGLATICGISPEGCLGGFLTPGLGLVIAIIALFTWPVMARIVRGQVLSLREREFVEASRSLGASAPRIMFRELLPNLLAPVLIYSTLLIPSNILFEAALSYLGVGVPQTTPSWGRMLADATQGQLFLFAWWMMVFPGAFLVLTTLSFNLVGDGLRDALGPAERG